jgi:hypothetical protein
MTHNECEKRLFSNEKLECFHSLGKIDIREVNKQDSVSFDVFFLIHALNFCSMIFFFFLLKMFYFGFQFNDAHKIYSRFLTPPVHTEEIFRGLR